MSLPHSHGYVWEVQFIFTAIAVDRLPALSREWGVPMSQASVPRKQSRRARLYLHMQWVAFQERNPEFRKPESFIKGSEHACPLLQS